jgi:hypothetical protein
MLSMKSKKNPRSRTVDGICQHYGRKRSDLLVTKMSRGTVLIEGRPRALQFLGEVLIAHARGPKDDCHFGISPRGAGSRHFNKKSKFGVYIHRLPCKHGKIAK